MRVLITQMNMPPPVPAAVGNVVAAPGGTMGATPLPFRINIIVSGSAGQGVKLRTIGGAVQKVMNRTGFDQLVFPPDGMQIEGYGTDTGVAVPSGSGGDAEFVWDGALTWRV